MFVYTLYGRFIYPWGAFVIGFRRLYHDFSMSMPFWHCSIEDIPKAGEFLFMTVHFSDGLGQGLVVIEIPLDIVQSLMKR